MVGGFICFFTCHQLWTFGLPEYCERTFQSKKPTIELVKSKEFAARKIVTAIESAIHNTYQKQRLRGEWFDLRS